MGIGIRSGPGVSHCGELAHILLDIHRGEKSIDSYLTLELNTKYSVHGFNIHQPDKECN